MTATARLPWQLSELPVRRARTDALTKLLRDIEFMSVPSSLPMLLVVYICKRGSSLNVGEGSCQYFRRLIFNLCYMSVILAATRAAESIVACRPMWACTQRRAGGAVVENWVLARFWRCREVQWSLGAPPSCMPERSKGLSRAHPPPCRTDRHLRRVSHHSSAPWGWGMTLRWASDSLARPLIVASVFARNPRPTLVVVAGEDAADRMAVALSAYLGRDVVERYPERKDLPWSDKAPDGAVIGARCHAVARLAAGEECVVVASARALVRCVPPAGSRYFEPITYELATADPLRRRACPAAVSRLHERRRGRRARHLPRAWATPSTSFRPRRAPPCALSSSATRSTRSAAWCRRPARPSATWSASRSFPVGNWR